MIDNDKIKYFIITPVKISSAGQIKPWKVEAYNFEYRMNIFKKYTYPSIMNQSDLDFEWICTSSTSCLNPSEIQELKNIKGVTNLFFNEEETSEWFKHTMNYIKSKIKKRHEFLITTKLDNDDAYHINFVKKIKEYANQCSNKLLVTYQTGIQYDLVNKKSYLYTQQTSNPFITLIEKIDSKNLNDLKGVFFNIHSRMKNHFPIKFIGKDKIGWVQNIHENNILNKIDSKNEIPLNQAFKNFVFEE